MSEDLQNQEPTDQDQNPQEEAETNNSKRINPDRSDAAIILRDDTSFNIISQFPDLVQSLGTASYTQEKILEGVTNLDALKDAVKKNDEGKEDQKLARIDWMESKGKVDVFHSDTKEMAIAVFGGNERIEVKLNLKGKTPTANKDWFPFMENFLSDIQEEQQIAEGLQEVGITVEMVNQANTDLSNARCKYNKYQASISRSQDLTDEKNKALEVHQDWMSRFRRIAKVVLKDHPQLMEVLGKRVK